MGATITMKMQPQISVPKKLSRQAHSSGGGLTEKLRKLGNAKKYGYLSEAEYATKKRELLDNMVEQAKKLGGHAKKDDDIEVRRENNMRIVC